MDSVERAAAADSPPSTDAQRESALGDLKRRRSDLTLSELAEADRRLQDARTTELEDALGPPDGGPVAAAERRRWLVVFLGGHSQRGRWRLGRELRLVCVLGGAELDLRQAIVDADEVSLTCVCVLGGARLIVPEGISVSYSCLSILGGRSDERAPAAAIPGSPRIHVRLFSLLGGIEIADGRDDERRRRSVELAEDGVRVRLSGWVALAGLRRELLIPYTAIREVSAGPAELPPAWALRIGTALPFTDVRHGLFRWGGRWRFYSLNDRREAITLELDGFTLGGRPVDAVVLGVGDPEDLKRRLEAARPTTTE